MSTPFPAIQACPGATWADKVIAYGSSAKQQLRRNKIRGSLIGGAAGDALGYAVEFDRLPEIRQRYGEWGITAYALDAHGKAIVSDDTQMTLFTANGLLNMQTQACLYGEKTLPTPFIIRAYDDWYATQVDLPKSHDTEGAERQYTWLYNVPELHHERAPGMTCISALREAHGDPYYEDTDNNSKGCGGVMRVAPVGLFNGFADSPEKVIDTALRTSAITHGHSLGMLPSCVLAELVRHIVYDDPKPNATLKDAVLHSIQTVAAIYRQSYYWNDLATLLEQSIERAENAEPDTENIEALGEGWVAEETLAIAIYCALRHAEDFSDGIIAAVNHDGDSDSTGSITGNILGAWLGFDTIEQKWLDNLEMKEVILTVADDLCDGCPMDRSVDYTDDVWLDKYVNCTYQPKA
jgi:ADP-ribosylglycohydrolase